jgi:hypothetical protein
MGQQPLVGFTITRRHTKRGRTPLDEWSVWRRNLCLTTHNTHNRQTSIHPVGYEPTIPAKQRPQIHVVDRAATVIGPSVRFLITKSDPLRFIFCSSKHNSRRLRTLSFTRLLISHVKQHVLKPKELCKRRSLIHSACWCRLDSCWLRLEPNLQWY